MSNSTLRLCLVLAALWPEARFAQAEMPCRDVTSFASNAAFPSPFILEGRTLPSASVMLRECLPAGSTASPALTELDSAAKALSGLATIGRSFEKILSENGIKLCVHQGGADGRGWFEPNPPVLSVSSNLTAEEKFLVLAHELRHVDQWKRGYRMSLDVTIREHVRQTYALEADATAVAILAAWTGSGDPEKALWHAAVAIDRYDDIAQDFEAAMSSDDSQKDALLAAFRAWYRSPWRIEAYWRSACGNYLDQMDETHKSGGVGSLPADRFAGLCFVDGIGDYGCAETPEIAAVPSQP